MGTPLKSKPARILATTRIPMVIIPINIEPARRRAPSEFLGVRFAGAPAQRFRRPAPPARRRPEVDDGAATT